MNNEHARDHVLDPVVSQYDKRVRYVTHFAGLVPDPDHPGFRYVTLRPMPVKGLDRISAWHRAPAGIIRSAWTREAGKLTFDVTLPEGTSGELRLPDGGVVELHAGSQRVVRLDRV